MHRAGIQMIEKFFDLLKLLSRQSDLAPLRSGLFDMLPGKLFSSDGQGLAKRPFDPFPQAIHVTVDAAVQVTQLGREAFLAGPWQFPVVSTGRAT